MVPSVPPAASTMPFWSSDSVPPLRAMLRSSVAVHIPVAGLKISTPTPAGVPPVYPPVAMTRPSASRTSDAKIRAVVMFPVEVHIPVDGS